MLGSRGGEGGKGKESLIEMIVKKIKALPSVVFPIGLVGEPRAAPEFTDS